MTSIMPIMTLGMIMEGRNSCAWAGANPIPDTVNYLLPYEESTHYTCWMRICDGYAARVAITMSNCGYKEALALSRSSPFDGGLSNRI